MTDTRLFNANSRTQICVEISSDDLHVVVCTDGTANRTVLFFQLDGLVSIVWHVRARSRLSDFC